MRGAMDRLLLAGLLACRLHAGASKHRNDTRQSSGFAEWNGRKLGARAFTLAFVRGFDAGLKARAPNGAPSAAASTSNTRRGKYSPARGHCSNKSYAALVSTRCAATFSGAPNRLISVVR